MNPSKKAKLELIGAQATAQIALVAVLPLLTRQYSVSSIGIFQVSMAIAMTLQPLATLRVEFVIPATACRREVKSLSRMSYFALFVVAVIGMIVALCAIVSFGSADVAFIALMSSLIVVALAWTAIDNAQLVRQGHLKRLAIRNLTAGVSAALLQLTSALFDFHVIALAMSIFVGRVVAIAITRVSKKNLAVRSDKPGPDARYTFRRIVMSVGSGIVATGTSYSLVIASGLVQSASSGGYIGVAQRVAGAPLTLIGQGLGQVMQSSVSPLIRERRAGLTRIVLRQVCLLAVVAAGFSALMISLAPVLAVPLLGKGWAPAGVVIAILAVPMSFQLVVGPLMTILPLLGREGLLFLIQASRFVLVVGSVIFTVGSGFGLYAVAVAFGIATAIGYGGMLALVWQQVRSFDSKCRGV